MQKLGLGKLDHNANTKISEDDMKNLKDIMELKEKKTRVVCENKINDKQKNVNKQDLDKLNHNAKAKIGKSDTEEMKHVTKLKEKKLLLFRIN